MEFGFDKDQTDTLAMIILLSEIVSPLTSDVKLSKRKKSGIITRLSPEVESGKYNINEYLNFDKYNQTIINFENTLKKKLSHCNTTNFYENLKTLKITERERNLLAKLRKILFKNYTAGSYLSDKNQIIVYKNSNERRISEKKHQIEQEGIVNHELLHTASSSEKRLINKTGFQLSIDNRYEIGRGINEGYTERLNLKYFSPEKKPRAYITLRFLSEGIEKIVGTKNMEKMYFDGDLRSLINEIGEYSSKDQAMELIKKLDDCYYAKSDEEEMLARQIRTEIGNILLTKNRKLLQENKITQEDYEREVIKSAFFVKDYKFEIDDSNEEVRFVISSNPNYSIMPLDTYRIIRNTYFMRKQEPISFDLTDAEINNNDIVDCMKKLIRYKQEGILFSLTPNNTANNDSKITVGQGLSTENNINTELSIIFDDYTSPNEDDTDKNNLKHIK